ncbi:MAG: hypothetical protein NTV87_05865 [Ignavibacteriae bacterium]|nr:hypothetical protein [Ignavibacteriota bacterium]
MEIKSIAIWVKQSKTGESYLSVNIEFVDESKANYNVFKNKSENPNAPQFKFWKKDDNSSGSGNSGNFANVSPDWANPAGPEITPDDIFQPPANDDDLPF